MDVVLVDSGGANIGSVTYAFERLGVSTRMSADADVIRRASHVVLPGVGAAAAAMRHLHDNGLVDVIRGLRQPVLGVCLGMQILFEHSGEGDTPCLGIIQGRVKRLPEGDGLRIPHMGWNTLDKAQDDPLLAELQPGDQAYFVHSYAAPVTADTLATSTHGERFAAIVRHDNFRGIQCHPERSARVGATLIRNFLAS